MVTLPDLTDYTDDDLQSLIEAVFAEQNRRRVLAQFPDQVAQWAEITGAAQAASPEPATEYQAGTSYPPGQLVTYNGLTWRNPLPVALHDTTPGDPEHPFWVEMPDDNTPAPIPWTTNEVLHVGTLYSYNGQTWRYRGTEGATGDPNLAPANNAAWELVG